MKWWAKTYSIEELMSGEWIERYGGFSSQRKAYAYLRRVNNSCYGKLRVVRIIRQPLK